MKIKVNYIIEEGKKRKKVEVEVGKTILELFNEDIEKASENNLPIVGVRVNNSVKRLDYKISKIDENVDVELIDVYNKDGRDIYIRTLLFIMSKAIYELYPKMLIKVEYQLTNAMYITIGNKLVTDKLLKEIKAKMEEIVEKQLDINVKRMTKEEADVFYSKFITDRGELQLLNKDKKDVVLYYCEKYFNYFYGILPTTTKEIKRFDLKKYSDGFLVMYPDAKDFKQKIEFKNTKKIAKAFEEYQEVYKLLGIQTIADLNERIKKDPRELIVLSEALHEKKIFDLSQKIQNKKDVKMILIAGPSSSGKTTFAGKLSSALKIIGIKPKTISVDNYFVEREDTPVDEKGNYDFETIDAIDTKLFNKDLKALIEGKEIEMPTFDFHTGHKVYNGKKMKLNKDEILIIEGIHCLNDKLTEKIDEKYKFKIYISALTVLNIDSFNRISTTDTRMIRRTIRDNETRGYSAEHTLGMWYSVRRGETKNIFPFQENADFVFNSSAIYELAVLKKHIIPLLKEISKDKREYSEARRIVSFMRYFEDIPDELVPSNSLIREFIGGSLYEERRQKLAKAMNNKETKKKKK